ncbi:golgi apparatus membrane protein-like protein tvp23 [Lophiotrema nucula]|uniref:Golgi apparatus membrane protein TVP23 n=1 Tax=Lophiotrema nucula TaxID=690887 RepID=A0A6A5ZGY4_9PLEO|nr:golgi apparatus membrane protein-like protein tvp23 [Lophiotrema nucula]
MENAQQTPAPGSLSWRLSSHPITLITFLFFRISSLLVYLFGLRLFTSNFVLIFIITILLLATDFYYLKNIAGRRLVGLRWWNEVDTSTGDSKWVFESADPETRTINATDKRFFWIALYAQPVLWVLLAIVALASLEFIWLTLVGMYTVGIVVKMNYEGLEANGHVVIALVLTITNTLAFSRADKFSQATSFGSTALYGSGLARNLAGGVVSNWFRR